MLKVDNKTVLAIVVSESGSIGYYTGKRTISTNIEYSVVETENPNPLYPVELIETIEKPIVSTKRTSLLFPYGPEKNTCISDFGMEFIDTVALRAVSSNLWHVHGKQANPHIYRLWLDSISRLSEAESKEAEYQYRTKYESFLAVVFDLFYGKGLTSKEVRRNLSDVFDLDIPESKLYTIKKEAELFHRNGSSGYQVVKTHKYIMVRTASGNRKRVEILPKHEFVFTEWFREWLHVSRIIDDSNGVSDMIQVAKLAIWELVNFGLINDYSDLSGMFHTSFYKKSKVDSVRKEFSRDGGYIGYVYSKINRFIASERAFSVRTEEYVPEVHLSGSFPPPEAKAISEAWKAEFIRFVLDNMKIREKARKNYTAVIVGLYFGEESERTLSEKLHISSVAVHKASARIREFITTNPGCLEFLKASGYFGKHLS